STARAVAQVYQPNYLAVRYFGGFIPWVFKDIAVQREIDGNGLPGYRRNAKSDVQATPTYRYFPGTGGNITYSKTALWLNTIARWYGEAIFPVDIVVTFRNGERISERWDGVDRWKAYSYDRASPALSAQVDPNRVLLLDVDYTNNSRTLEPKSESAARKWAAV